MSAHRYTGFGFTATCACGWHGPDRGRQEGESVHQDYAAHVEEALGAACRYDADVKCINCGFRGAALIHVGCDAWSATCPRCNVRGRCRPDNDAYHEESEDRRARWPF